MQSFPDFSVDENVTSTRTSSIMQTNEPKKTPQIQMNYDIRSLIRELQSLKNETIEIKDALQRAAKGKMVPRIKLILEKVDSLIHILSSHMARAQAILNSIQKVIYIT